LLGRHSGRRSATMNTPTASHRTSIRDMKSAVDTWVAVVLVGSALVALWATGVLILDGDLISWMIAVPVALLGTILPLWMLLHTVYRLDDDHLVARSGPFRWRVPYADIRTVSRKKEWMSGPALSMDRLVIDYGPMRWLIISPHDPEAFRSALLERVQASD